MQAHILAYNQMREYDEAKEQSELAKAMIPKSMPTGKPRKGGRR